MAQLTVTVDDTHVDRIRAAYAGPDRLPSEVTVEEVRQDLVTYLKAKVRLYEDKQARLLAESSVSDITAS
jgi:acyl-coenzyme A thioesterase PaaI-like protein